MHPNSRLVLGTAQLGMSYGVANCGGQPSRNDARKIVQQAWDAGVVCFDTAQAYGESETVLGDALTSCGIEQHAKVITKLHPRLLETSSSNILDEIQSSLERCSVSKFHGLMLHNEDGIDHLSGPLGQALEKAMAFGLVENIGVSVYHPQFADKALDIPLITQVQLPANILDQRFAKANIFEKANRLEKQVFIRSAFLQGLLCMSPSTLPVRIQQASTVLEKYVSLCKRYGLSAADAALGYLRVMYPNALVLFGAEKVSQVEINVASWGAMLSDDFLIEADVLFPEQDVQILNPSNWRKS